MDSTCYVYDYMCIYKYIHARTINEKRGAALEGDQGRIYGEFGGR